MSGERPSPRYTCTLTALDNHRAMAFAGRSKEGRFNDTFILDVHRMVTGFAQTTTVYCYCIHCTSSGYTLYIVEMVSGL